MATSIPASIGPFRVESLLGVGGMGQVYKAVDPTLGRTVAVKILKSDDRHQSFVRRLLREAQAYGRLKHPNIVTVYEAREAEGGLYIAMEYLEGSSLSAVLTRDELPLEARIGVLIQILDALAYAHAQGIVHRDIKPSNIHVLADGTVKLLDFGLARVVQAETLTATDTVMGTPHYASPEQLTGQEIDGRTDVYSTGVVAFEMLTRRRPFDGASLGTIVAKVLSEPTPPMDTPWSRAFPELERIVRRAMAKRVHERYAGAVEMQGELKAFLCAAPAAADVATVRVVAPTEIAAAVEPAPAPDAPSPLISAPSPPPAHRGRALALWLGAFSVVAGIAIGASLLDSKDGNGPLPDRKAAAGVENSGKRGTPPSDEPPGPPPPRVSGEGNAVRAGSKRASAIGNQQVAVEPRSVFIEPSGDASLDQELANALAGQGVKTAATAERASLSVRARIEISNRPAPFGGSSALTADFVATLQLRDASGSLSSRSIDGHALDFGEAVVKLAAHRRAAEQLAEIVHSVMRD